MPEFAAPHLLADPLDTPELPPGDADLPAAGYSQSVDFDPVEELYSWQAPPGLS